MTEYTPTNEQGVVFLFGQLLSGVDGIHPTRISIEFPDATIEVDGKAYSVEFEYIASNFLTHGHDVRHCDLVVCWQDDLVGSDFPLPVIELQTATAESLRRVDPPSQDARAIYYWRRRCEAAEREVAKHKRIIEELVGDDEIDAEPHPCPYCGRSDFATPQALSAHLRFCEARKLEVSE